MAEVKKKGKSNSLLKTKGEKNKTGKSNVSKNADELTAAKQKRSIIMFLSGLMLSAVIYIPGELVWLWLHNAVRGLCSLFSWYWPLLLVTLAVSYSIFDDKKRRKKMWLTAAFVSGLVLCFNAAVYIFTYKDAFDIKGTFSQGIDSKGGGVMGFLLGAPFVKLFGVTPAKILIALITLVVLVFAVNVHKPVTKIFEYLTEHISEWFEETVKKIKRKQAKIRPVKIADDVFFDDDKYDEYDLHDDDENEQNDDDEENSAKGGFLKKNHIKIKTKPKDNDTDSDDSFDGEIDDLDDELSKNQSTDDNISDEAIFDDDNDDTFDELDQQDTNPFDSDDSYSIDIDIDGDMDTGKGDSVDNYSNEELTKDVFGDLLQDDIPEASKIARDISVSKKNNEEPANDKRVFRSNPNDSQKPAVLQKQYKYPSVNLLSKGKKNNQSYETELRENAGKLIETLDSFSVGAKITGYCRGPSITRYEIKPAPGVKISRITSLADDIALGLAADAVRIEAPIPGKPAIGIEVPNKSVASVTMRELIDSEEFRKQKSVLACVLGRDLSNNIVVSDLAKMPHLLIAGTTGSGKSVCVNSILMSIIFRAAPDQVKLILIDPKRVEFTKYKGIPHLLVPVVDDVKKAAAALNWAVNEMENRYGVLSLYNVKDIDSYNKMVEKNWQTMTPEEIADETEEPGKVVNGVLVPPKAKTKMSKIVIAIDELADLMMVAPGEVEDAICRLAQKARAAGMHLVVATQRPSVNVITGVIKANIPSRISLKVAAVVDSKTILDMGGGEKLIGRGDMLYNPVGSPKPIRVQGGFSSDEDIEAVTEFLKNNCSSSYDEAITEEIERISQEGIKTAPDEEDDDMTETDPLLNQAIDIVVAAGQASTSLLQRKMKVGYARAGRLVDTMEQMGIVGPHEGSKSRKVLMTPEQNLERKMNSGG